MNFNKAIVAGNLTRDPELRTLPSGGQVASFGMATNRFWKDKSGVLQKDATFHNIVIFGAMAETAGKYLTKGGSVLIEGRIQNRSYEDKAGQKRYISEIVAESMQLGPKTGTSAGSGSPRPSVKTAPVAEPEVPIVKEDEETPVTTKKAGKKTKATEDDEFDIEEDIPF